MREIEIEEDDISIEHKINNKSKFDNNSVSIRLSVFLIEKLKNIVASNKAGGDFKYTSVGHIIRSAIKAYQNGMTLRTQSSNDKKRDINVKMASNELRDFYFSLPQGVKSEICERAISTYIRDFNNSI